jgi:methyl-accepting chemotaxis protein
MSAPSAEDTTLRDSQERAGVLNRTLPTPEAVDRKFTKYSICLGIAPLPPVLLYLWSVTHLSLEQLILLAKVALAGLVLGVGAGTVIRKRGGGQQDHILEYLRHRQQGSVTSEIRAKAFTATMLLPRTLFWVSFYSWSISSPAAGVVLYVFSDNFPLLSAACFASAGFAGAILCTVPSFVAWKSFVAPIRETIAAEFARARERAPLISKLPMQRKLGFPIMGLILVTFVFGTTLAEVRANRSIERATVQLQERVLEELAPLLADRSLERADLLEAYREKWALAGLDFVIIDAEAGTILGRDEVDLPEDAFRILLRKMKKADVGNSADFDSRDFLAWRALPEESRFILARSRPKDIPGDRLSFWRNLLVLAVTLVAAAVASFVGARDLVNDIRMMRDQVQRMTEGDLRPGEAFDAEDELGDLAREMQTMAETLRETVGEVVEAAGRVDSAAAEFGQAGKSVAEITVQQVNGVRQVSASIESVTKEIRGLADSSQDLSHAVSESASSVLELKTTSQGLTDTAEDLSEKAEETSASVEQSLRSIAEISRNTEALAGGAGEAASSMEEMAQSVREVDVNAGQTAQLSARVVEVADRGKERVEQTIEGIKVIRKSTGMAEQVVRTLRARTEEIGEFTDIITQVADETNLLALNAAIIAAQAGTHGRAFAVVADEIKNLASNVLANTKEIATVIESLQQESSRAVSVIEQGNTAVENGAALSEEAGRSLVEINEAARESGERMREVGTAVSQQAAATAQVAQLIERLHQDLERIRRATREQHQGSEIVQANAVLSKEAAHTINRATQEQVGNAGQIAQSFESVRRTADEVDRALKEQSTACRRISEFLEEMKQDTQSNEDSARLMGVATEALREQANLLRQKVQRFRV